MAIQTAAFIQGFKDLSEELLDSAKDGNPKPDGYFEEQLGALLETLILSITITVSSGITVQVSTGSGTGATTGTGTGAPS